MPTIIVVIIIIIVLPTMVILVHSANTIPVLPRYERQLQIFLIGGIPYSRLVSRTRIIPISVIIVIVRIVATTSMLPRNEIVITVFARPDEIVTSFRRDSIPFIIV
ncbi:hypothetical protein FRB94_014319 [Tulasnella sp. JGI-2019a]|nr:hypothetical protein FRB93_009012 [Tulasnella sp. JGI-2019a]KAG8989508.1 hypothetical protein FRB94_014319 [Tulasnella sp. JGI-2019a]KAG9024774.1 hypothetical protein FRB95_011064 [Tulasnella sp. JGI-2019a]